jgi:N-formylmaleamate deformylase
MSGLEATLASWNKGYCRANGINIHYLRTGGDKSPLVLLHGLTSSGACMAPLARRLEQEFDVILPDCRGHGSSSDPEKGYLYDDLAGDVIGLIEALHLSAPVLAGHSMGGMTAAVAATKLGPVANAVVLIDPTFISPSWQREVYESNIVAEHEAILLMDRNKLIAESKLRHPDRQRELISFQVDAKLQTSVSAFEVLTPPNPDWSELVRDICAPIILLIGDRGVVSRETANELTRINPGLRYALVPDAGHGLPFDKPAQAAATIMTFLAEMAAG